MVEEHQRSKTELQMRVLGAVFVLNAGVRQEIATTFRKRNVSQ